MIVVIGLDGQIKKVIVKGGVLQPTDTDLTGYVPYTGATQDVDLGSNNISVADEAYGVSWDGNLEAPTKNAVYDKIETIGGGSPGGADTYVQFNDSGSFGGDAGFIYDKTTNTTTVDKVKTDTVQAKGSGGVAVHNASGADVALFGAGGGQNATFYDGVKLDASTASRILSTDASKNITALDTATYPSLTELAYVKGVTSAIQTQLNAKLGVSDNAVSATVLDTARLINGVSFDGSADINVIDSLNMYAAMGSVILGSSYNLPLGQVQSTVALSNQSFRLVPIWLPKSGTITGVKWFQVTQGDYTANNYNGVGLYTYSAGTLTLVASSTDDGNIWKATAGTWSSKAFSSTYSASAGLLFVGLLWCRSAQVTAPSLGTNYSPGSSGSVVLDLTNSAKIAGSVASLTALPATQAMSGVTASTNCYAIGIY